MTINQLRYVVEVAKTGSINQAANNLFISHTTLSSAVRSLERELGEAIFVRSSKGVHLTPFGNMFTAHVVPLQVSLEQLNAFSDVGNQRKKTKEFSIASNGYPFIAKIFRRLREEYPTDRLTLRQYEQNELEIPAYVADRIVDLGLIRIWNCYEKAIFRQFEVQKLDFSEILEIPLGITIGPENPLYAQAEPGVTANQLKGFPVVKLNSNDVGPYSDIFKQLDLPDFTHKIVTTSRATLYEILEETDAIYLDSLYPDPLYENMYGLSQLRPRRTLQLLNCTVTSKIGWVTRKNTPLTELGEKFTATANAWLKPRTS
ncbi:MAG: LysR family transcriptional regulator [Lachnospiraceae bacterium]|nr:LysR family transcriptional regulator [Lachnospiraceae bacterium]